ncbi:hypothetical protein ALQ65_200077 [Pseudomonas syringae pv. coriandricola]|uniref:TrbL/VirB6 plasmid conjugal transfer protein n=2 Tax=Pseudomonas syringae group genomosp. 3 TaxID=251701 RepID=A0A3M3JRK0_9PSED|nr:hypothetical protein ALQ65_200077 [Pseudomonas syringae pv. coriandricola]
MSPFLITLLMALGTLFSTCGCVVLHMHRKQRRLQALAVKDDQEPRYIRDLATGHFVQVHDRLPVPAYNVGLLSAKKRQAIIMCVGMMIIFCLPLVIMPKAEAALSDSMRGIFSGELKNFVTGMMEPGNSVNNFAWMVFSAFSVMLLIVEVAKFIWQGNQTESHLIALCMFFVTFMIMGGYDEFTSAIWGIAVGVSDGYQEQLVGNTDNFFLSQWMHKVFAAVVVEDLDMWDSIKLLSYNLIWMVAGVILDGVAYLAAMWADFGYAVAKVVGFIFIPCLLLPATRSLFDGWFKFFTGFGFLLIVLKATLVVAAIALKAIVGTLGVKYSGGGFAGEPSAVDIGTDQMYLLVDAGAMLGIAALFVLSSFAFAGSLAGGLGNLSGGLGTAAGLAVKKFLK